MLICTDDSVWFGIFSKYIFLKTLAYLRVFHVETTISLDVLRLSFKIIHDLFLDKFEKKSQNSTKVQISRS